MPQRAKQHNPRALTAGGNPVQREDRPSACKRGYDGRWRKARAAWLHDHPLCVECEAEGQLPMLLFQIIVAVTLGIVIVNSPGAGRLTPATVVDHVVPHRGDKDLFWDSEENWQGLCTAHHNAKTARGE